jgi:RpiB/LacA/LacB family sugar-phosphate isomerase
LCGGLFSPNRGQICYVPLVSAPGIGPGLERRSLRLGVIDMSRVVIASDHAGYRLKQELVGRLCDAGDEVEDLGPADERRVDYPDFAVAVAERVAREPGLRGVLVCGTGIGMAIAANKVAGVRAAVVDNEFSARLARQHNDVNVLCVGARVLAPDRAAGVVRAWLDAVFQGGRHQDRLDKISALERR